MKSANNTLKGLLPLMIPPYFVSCGLLQHLTLTNTRFYSPEEKSPTLKGLKWMANSIGTNLKQHASNTYGPPTGPTQSLACCRCPSWLARCSPAASCLGWWSWVRLSSTSWDWHSWCSVPGRPFVHFCGVEDLSEWPTTVYNRKYYSTLKLSLKAWIVALSKGLKKKKDRT